MSLDRGRVIADSKNSALQAEFFERLHRGPEEPFSYSTRAVERLRHEWIVRQVAAATTGLTLDLGCSRGQLTGMLAELAVELVAVDVAPSAIAGASERLSNRAVRFA